MKHIRSFVDLNTEKARQNASYHLSLSEQLRERLARVRQGGSGRQRHEKNKKLFVRDRITQLCDKDSSFFELSALAADQVYDVDLPSAAIVTGIGSIAGCDVMIMANDATSKGGCYFPLTIKKQLRAQEIAMQNHLPCIYLLDTGGIYLPLQAESCADREHIGRITFMQSRMSAQSIPQISVVLGSCTAAGAYMATLSDEVIMVKNQGTIFLGGPFLVKAATGESTTAEALGGADMHCQISGVADYIANSEEEALTITGHCIKSLNLPFKNYPYKYPTLPPLYDPQEIYSILPIDEKEIYDSREIICRLLDNSEFQEFKPNEGKTIVTGFGRLQGFSIGMISNNGPIFSESALKATHFIQLCTQRGIPLVFLQNTPGFMVGTEEEKQGISKHGAKLIHAVANTSVPKLTVIIGSTYGAAYFAMAGSSFSPHFIWAWPHIRMGAMGPIQAEQVLAEIHKSQRNTSTGQETSAEIESQRERLYQKYESETRVDYFASRVMNDGVIEPSQTREVLGRALEIVHRVPFEKKPFGVFRM